jgi:hypothetical protein
MKARYGIPLMLGSATVLYTAILYQAKGRCGTVGLRDEPTAQPGPVPVPDVSFAGQRRVGRVQGPAIRVVRGAA